jgi:hypothetical protein
VLGALARVMLVAMAAENDLPLARLWRGRTRTDLAPHPMPARNPRPVPREFVGADR